MTYPESSYSSMCPWLQWEDQLIYPNFDASNKKNKQTNKQIQKKTHQKKPTKQAFLQTMAKPTYLKGIIKILNVANIINMIVKKKALEKNWIH